MIENRFEIIFSKIITEMEEDLSPSFTYHNASHTKYVIEKAEELASLENIKGNDLELIKFAALYHDAGFLLGLEDHERLGCQIAVRDLSEALLTNAELEKVCSMIDATKIPQGPKNNLENIVADADLFYLGTSSYTQISHRLFVELKNFDPSMDQEKWLSIQTNFLRSHSYHTKYGKEILEPVKQKNLEALIL